MRRVISWYFLALLLIGVCTAALIDSGYIPVSGKDQAPLATQTSSSTSIFTNTPSLTPKPTSTSTATPTLTPTITKTPTVTPTITPTPYVFQDNVMDALFLSELIGVPVTSGKNCLDPISYRLDNGLCFEDFGVISKKTVLQGPYYLGLFTEINAKLEFLSVRFYVFYMDQEVTHQISPKKFKEYFWGKSWTRAKGETWVSPYLAWSIPEDTYELLVAMGREYNKDAWIEAWGP